MTDETLTIEINCHANPYDGTDGYPTLEEIRTRYGIAIEKVAGPPGWEQWADWYQACGTRAQLVAFLTEEYCGNEADAQEMVPRLLFPPPRSAWP